MNDKEFVFKDDIALSKNGLILVGTLKINGNDYLKRVYDPHGACPTIATMSGGNQQPKFYFGDSVGVRKLTPRECWALMGFDNELFSKVEGKFSNAQLYKQAGNTICVKCLEAIFKKMFEKQ